MARMAGYRMKALRTAVLLMALPLTFGAPAISVPATSVPPSPADGDLVYVGMHGAEIRAGRFDARSGTLAMIGPVASVPRPTWTIRHPRLPIIYAANEDGNDGARNGSIIAFRADRRTGSLTRLNEVDAGGGGTTYLTLDPRSMTLVAANYAGGSVATFPVLADGRIGPRASLVAATGSGPHRRQAKPHAHSVLVDPTGRFILVADLGADRIFIYPFDGRRHAIRPDAAGSERHFVATSGSGPRHIAFAPDGRFLYLINELTADVQVLRWDARRGRLTLVQTLPIDAPDHQGTSSASEIAVSADGRFVYAGNRAENRLVVLAVDQAKGTLSIIQRIGAGGEVPWGFSLHPGGRWLLVANERSDRINILAIDRRTGRLTDSGRSADTPKPVSISFLR